MPLDFFHLFQISSNQTHIYKSERDPVCKGAIREGREKKETEMMVEEKEEVKEETRGVGRQKDVVLERMRNVEVMARGEIKKIGMGLQTLTTLVSLLPILFLSSHHYIISPASFLLSPMYSFIIHSFIMHPSAAGTHCITLECKHSFLDPSP